MNNTTGTYEYIESNIALYMCIEHAEKTTNISTNPWQLIYCFRGPQAQDLGTAIGVTVINAIIFIAGLLGNIAVCIVILKHHSLHSPTEYYLLNLAISDLTLLIFGLPYDVALFWHQYPWLFGEFSCKARALISETATYVSVLTVVAFSTERYLAICHPLYTMAITNLQRSLRIILCLWVLSFICAIPFAVYSGVEFIRYPIDSDNIIPQSAFCAMTSQPEQIPLAEISTICFFVIPLIIIILQYVKMGVVMRQTAKKGYLSEQKRTIHLRNSKQFRSRHKVVKMLSFVVFSFFICWSPFHTQRLISIYLNDNVHDEINYWMYIAAGIFYYFSSTLNPILYNLLSAKMRNAFKEVLCGLKVNHVEDRSSYFKGQLSHLSDSPRFRDTRRSSSSQVQRSDEEQPRLVKNIM